MSISTVFLLSASIFATVISIEKTYFSLEDADRHFEDFIQTYDKHYASEAEKKMRLEIFKQNLHESYQLHADPIQKDAIFGITMFFDLTKEEFLSLYSCINTDLNDTFPVSNDQLTLGTDAPQNWDWREHGAVTNVKNQGTCGACWAFSTTGTVEGAYARTYGTLISLSEQQLLDCDTTNLGCRWGGFPPKALSYLQSYGAEGEQDYPYEEIQRQCRYDPSRVRIRIKGQHSVDLSDENALRQTLFQYGPIVILVDSSTFTQYNGGIWYCPPEKPNHAVLLVGYGTAGNGVPYWIIKNSWGTRFGEAGYIRVRGGGNPCGMYMFPGVLALA